MSQQFRTIYSTRDYAEISSYLENLKLNEKDKFDIKTFEADFSDGKLEISLKKRIENGDEFSRMVGGTWNFFENIETKYTDVKVNLTNEILTCETAIGIVSDSNFKEVDSRAEFIFKLMEKFDGIMFDGQGMTDKNGKIILDYDGSSEIANAA